jgi:hypothetical protein
MDILQNLRDRVEVKRRFAVEEASSAEGALARSAEVLREAGCDDAATRIDTVLAADAEADPVARVVALREALVSALDVLHAQPGGLSDAGREALAGHLAPQTVRDIAMLKPSLLNEISKG